MKEKKLQEELNDFDDEIPLEIPEEIKPEISEEEKKLRFKVYAN
ncbi:MAG: hypothetical protein ABH850_01230 [Candidatus Micrarchaeota archaeon]